MKTFSIASISIALLIQTAGVSANECRQFGIESNKAGFCEKIAARSKSLGAVCFTARVGIRIIDEIAKAKGYADIISYIENNTIKNGNQNESTKSLPKKPRSGNE